MKHCRVPITSALLLLPLLGGCNAHPLERVCYQHYGEDTTSVSMDSRRKVDILFVIDDSGSMGEEQGALAENFGVLVEQLEQLEVDADYRIGITTTQSANPHCQTGGDEVGVLRLRSCWSHLDDFVFGGTDRRDEACRQACPEALAELLPLPSALEEGGSLVARPWLERSRGGTNVPEGVTGAQALACWGPQGIAGCGYESPLEAMLAALERSDDDGDPAAGFLRDDALLQVVIITDEADCSTTLAGAAAFDPDGSRALWPDPGADQAPSAVCWAAGVACQSLPEGRIGCEPADVDLAGQPTTPEGAVLHPLSRYVELLDRIDAHKRQVMKVDEPQVLLSVIAGVPPGWAGEALDYQPGDDAGFLANFGVGAGCRSDKGEAVPPVRLLAMADAFADEPGTNLFSICDGDYRPALQSIATRLIEQLSRPTCIDTGDAGSRLVVDGRATHCIVEQRVGQERRAVPTCTREGEGWALPEGESLCSYAVVDEQVHPTCAANDQVVELRYLQAPEAEFGVVEVTCETDPGLGCGGA
ncbi:MAG: hypothetical protein KDK70_28455 [Myxococcales bacterium]|nr:hypothetical protein [Myxococcales bacterium]